MKVPQIKYTKDYGIFKMLINNRELSIAHLRKLKKAIEEKNFLHLFPIVVNQEMEVIEGQHRLTVAQELGTEIFYVVDNHITPLDIAMVNCNRKSWTIKDFILHHAMSGKQEFRQLQALMNKFPKLTVMGAVRLMDATIRGYYEGGSVTRKVRAGDIDTKNYKLAELISEVGLLLFSRGVEYAFNPYFLCDIKNAVIQSGKLQDQAIKVLKDKQSLFPKMHEGTYPNFLPLLKEILEVNTLGSKGSREMVTKFLEAHNIEQ